MRHALFLAGTVAVFALTGCKGGEPAAPETEDLKASPSAVVTPAAAEEEANPANIPGNACAEITSHDWTASVDEQPGPGAGNKPLVVAGQADIDPKDWAVTLKEVGRTKDIPYTLRLELVAKKLSADPKAADKPGTVRFTLKAPGPVAKVNISCGRMRVASLDVARPQ